MRDLLPNGLSSESYILHNNNITLDVVQTHHTGYKVTKHTHVERSSERIKQ